MRAVRNSDQGIVVTDVAAPTGPGIHLDVVAVGIWSPGTPYGAPLRHPVSASSSWARAASACWQPPR